jgi:hypothetical protein
MNHDKSSTTGDGGVQPTPETSCTSDTSLTLGNNRHNNCDVINKPVPQTFRGHPAIQAIYSREIQVGILTCNEKKAT